VLVVTLPSNPVCAYALRELVGRKRVVAHADRTNSGSGVWRALLSSMTPCIARASRSPPRLERSTLVIESVPSGGSKPGPPTPRKSVGKGR
jgi:hypothetical protein